MACFALGKLPLLFLFGALGALLPKHWNKLLFKPSAVVVAATGLKLLIRGLSLLH